MTSRKPAVDSKTHTSIMVWDPLVRIFHWSLVTFFVVAYLTEDDFQTAHSYAGYAISLLILFRLSWGFIGTRHARFRDFVTGPRRLLTYLGRMVVGRAPRYLGHNPAGAAMVAALLTTLLATTISGIVLLGGEGAGPMAGVTPPGFGGKALEEVHEFLANTTLALVLLHIVGVLFSSIAHRENLIGSMITGRKPEYRPPHPRQHDQGAYR